LLEVLLQLFSPEETIELFGRENIRELYGSRLSGLPAELKREVTEAILPLLQPYYKHLIAQWETSVADILDGLQRRALAPERLRALKAPIYKPGDTGGGMPANGHIGWSFLREEVTKIASTKREKRLKVLLGGTLLGEVLLTRDLLVETLESLGENLKEWDIEVIGYSIETGYLVDIARELSVDRNLKAPIKLRLEFLDLLNKQDRERMALEAPDVVFTASSLYITSHYDYPWMRTPEYDAQRAEHMKYIKFVHSILPEGGVFVIEGPSQVSPPIEHLFRQHIREDGKHSGVFVKIPASDIH
jgi:hypothetical protein